ncbi:MAG: hypothetical protein JRN21_10795, partial [Nitrososphaerota archaeon]|nr:hypothetical protein [Nitrososphaerota archaeon]
MPVPAAPSAEGPRWAAGTSLARRRSSLPLLRRGGLQGGPIDVRISSTGAAVEEPSFRAIERQHEGGGEGRAGKSRLDEGIDVPEASIGVIVSGTGSSREFVQRLGRLLRKSEGKGKARLIELVSRETSETRTSSRRKRARGRRRAESKAEEEKERAPEP